MAVLIPDEKWPIFHVNKITFVHKKDSRLSSGMGGDIYSWWSLIRGYLVIIYVADRQHVDVVEHEADGGGVVVGQNLELTRQVLQQVFVNWKVESCRFDKT